MPGTAAGSEGARRGTWEGGTASARLRGGGIRGGARGDGAASARVRGAGGVVVCRGGARDGGNMARGAGARA